MRFLVRLVSLSVVAAALGSGFLYGHALGAHGQGRGARLRVERLLPFGKPAPMDDDSASRQPDEAVPPANVYEDVLDHVQKEFVENNATSNGRLNNGALARMFASLDDPHTYYLDPTLCRARREALQGHFYGIGAVLTVTRTQRADVEYRHLTVVDVMPGSPAERAGLLSGDNITAIDGHWIIAYNPLVDEAQIALKKEDESTRRSDLQQVRNRFQRGFSLSAALPRLTCGEGAAMHLGIERPGMSASLDLHLKTALTEVDPVVYHTAGNHIGYLLVRQFNPRAAMELRDTLRGLDPALQGLIVDLRSNPGGVRSGADDATDGVQALQALLEPLTPGGAVALLERRPAVGKLSAVTETLSLPAKAQRRSLSLVVLVDRGTANLAEAAAQCLREVMGAKIVGSHTFGDDRLPYFGALKGGGGVMMTTALLRSAHGVSLSRGVEPTVAAAGRNGSKDPGLLRAELLLKTTGE